METDMTKCRTRDILITSTVIAVYVFITALLSLLFALLFNSFIGGGFLGVAIWGTVVFKTPVFDWSFFNVSPNWVLIVGNQLQYDSIPDDENQRTKMFRMASLREVGSGLRGKKPWEVVYQSVDLQSELVLGKNQPVQCVTSDDIPLQIEWQCLLTPLRGYTVNMVRKGEEASIAFFQGEFTQFIIKWVKDRTEAQVFASLDNLKKEFEKVFDGPDKVHKAEKENGLFTNTPQIIRVQRDKRYQDAAVGGKIAEHVAGAVRTINDAFGDPTNRPDANMVLAAATATTGNEMGNVLIIPGLSGSAKDAAAVAAAISKKNK